MYVFGKDKCQDFTLVNTSNGVSSILLEVLEHKDSIK